MKKILCLALALVLTLSFTAFASEEDAPIIEVTSVSIISGVGDGAINTESALTANNTVQGWIINLKNNDTTTAKDVTIFCGIYDSNGLLIKVVTSEKEIAPDTADSIGLGTVIPATSSSSVEIAGGKAKLFIWNNLTDRSPYVDKYEFNIQ